jgi:hypothetical protein
MVCIFCIAVLAIVAGALTTAHLDEMEANLAEKAKDNNVKRTVDSDSVTKFDLVVRVGGKDAPVAVTIYKAHKRVRIQILTHELSREEVEQLEDELAEALGAEIVDRSDPEHEASAQHEAEHAAQAEAEDDETEERKQATSAPAAKNPAPPKR